MAVDLFGPADAGAALTLAVRPAETADTVTQDSYFRPCAGGPGTGTPITAVWLNRVTAALRSLARRSAVAESNADADILSRAVRSQRLNYVAATQIGGSANAVAATLAPAPNSWAEVDGAPLRFVPKADNTGPATFSPNGLAARPILLRGGALVGGELRAGLPVELLIAGTAAHVVAGGGPAYDEHDVTAGGYTLPSLAATPQGYEMTLRLTGTPAALPMPAITVTGGGSIIWRGQAVASLPTFGRGEVLHFRRVSDGWLMSVLAQAQRAALLATDGATAWQAGAYGYAQIPYLTTVGGEAEALFGFDGKKFTTPVAGEYFIQVRGQFNADAATGGAGVAITAGAFTTVGNAMNYAYADIAAGFSVNVATNVTHWLPAGQRVDFNFALTNGASRIRAQDFGVNVIYLGR